MKQIIEILKEWKENIDIDIIHNDDISNIGNNCRQSITLSQCIGMLDNLGYNNNIHQNITISK